MRKVMLSVLALIAIQAFGESKIYTWTDADGVVQFGDRPPISANASEIKMQGMVTTPVVVTAGALEGTWKVTGQPGETQEWLVREDGRIQIDIKMGEDRRIIHGNWVITGSVMTLTSDLVQDIIAGRSVIDNSPQQFVYKFLAFNDNTFRVFSNGSNYLGQK